MLFRCVWLSKVSNLSPFPPFAEPDSDTVGVTKTGSIFSRFANNQRQKTKWHCGINKQACCFVVVVTGK